MRTLDTPLDLYFDRLRELHNVKRQVTDDLPRLSRLATEPRLASFIDGQQRRGRIQQQSLAALISRHDRTPGTRVCRTMSDLLEGGRYRLIMVDSDSTRDLMLIGHCLQISHYQITACGTSQRLANRLGWSGEADVLRELMQEELDMAEELRALESEM